MGQPGQGLPADTLLLHGQGHLVGQGDYLQQKLVFSVTVKTCLTCSKTFCLFLIILLALTKRRKSTRESTWQS